MMRSFRKSDRELRVLTLGLDNSGKSTILKRLTDEDITSVTPTQGFNIRSVQKDGFKLNVWDVGGQKAIREYWSRYFTETDALIFVIDCADEARVGESGIELNHLLEDPMLAAVPVLILANKQDISTALTAGDITEAMTLNGIRDRHWHITECSAKTGHGLDGGIHWLVNNVHAR